MLKTLIWEGVKVERGEDLSGPGFNRHTPFPLTLTPNLHLPPCILLVKNFLFFRRKNVGLGGTGSLFIVTSNKSRYLHYGKLLRRQMQVNTSCRLLPSFKQVANKNIFFATVKARTFSAAMLGSAK